MTTSEGKQMNAERVFLDLLTAESEDVVTTILRRNGLLKPEMWTPLGDEENNFSIINNQHSDPTGALVEKLINAIDAVLMAACFKSGIDPQGSKAPPSMADAVEKFFGVKGGRLGSLDDKVLRKLALDIQLVATGSKETPSYLVVDRGEGQTPASFGATFLSLAKSNKLRIPFVQGKFNSGGTGVLQFCGTENYQLIASKRNPSCPTAKGDKTAGLWGFTIVRRVRPTESDSRRSSMYEYLAPDGQVPSFSANAIMALPGDSKKNEPAKAYTAPLEHGSVVKLYNYRWKARSIATTEARFELEKYLHSPCLPFRVTETRDYRANYYSTTVAGVWASISANESESDMEKQRVEKGFPAPASLDLPSVGRLNYRIAVFKSDVDSRRVPHGVFFSVNGQVHGQLPADFVSRRLEFEYLRNHLLVSVDCAGMVTGAREDFFMASRDRIRQNEVYDELVARLESDLKNHPGLRELNAARRARALEKALSDQSDVAQTFQDLLRMDPSLRALFNLGDRLVTKVGPTEAEDFKGRRFPTFFRINGDPKAPPNKPCPVNRTCRVEFETDAANDYFDRSDSPGEIIVRPRTALEYNQLWNGTYSTRFRPPQGAKPGDIITVVVEVTDPDRASRGKGPFRSQFTIAVGQPDYTTRDPGKPKKPKGPKDGKKEGVGLAMPNVIEVRKTDWEMEALDPPFTENDAIRVIRGGEGEFDYYINLDNTYLLTELSKIKESDKALIVYWFKWGLVVCAMGMLQHSRRMATPTNGSKPATNGAPPADDVQNVNQTLSGVASVIIPVIRNLSRGPVAP